MLSPILKRRLSSVRQKVALARFATSQTNMLAYWLTAGMHHVRLSPPRAMLAIATVSTATMIMLVSLMWPAFRRQGLVTAAFRGVHTPDTRVGRVSNGRNLLDIESDCKSTLSSCAAQGCVLVAGAAGFIGYHTTRSLVASGRPVIALDSLDAYYDPQLKLDRLACLGIDSGPVRNDISPSLGVESTKYPGKLCFVLGDAANSILMARILTSANVTGAVHLAAQAGVRYSLKAPERYIHSNILGFFSVLDAATRGVKGSVPVRSMVFASSSSVYGVTSKPPFHETEAVNEPISLYAATKKADEALAYSYSAMYRTPITGLRFFTVIGPWGRPDMALYRFSEAVRQNRVIELYGTAQARDFTYVGDVVKAIVCALDNPPPKQGESSPPYRILNVAAGRRVPLLSLLEAVERGLGMKSKVSIEAGVTGDTLETWGNNSALVSMCPAFMPVLPMEEAVKRFLRWYTEYEPGKRLSQPLCDA